MIEMFSPTTLPHCVHMACKLWPDATQEEIIRDFTSILDNPNWMIFLYKAGDEYIGFILMTLRKDYVEGSTNNPVAYIEGMYVRDDWRRRGIAAQLLQAGEAWGKEKGCTEIGSDVELNNHASIDFHNRNGFTEANRVVCFIKQL